MHLTFCVNLSESFRMGINCAVSQPVTIDIDPEKIHPTNREVIASRLDDKGVVCSFATACESDWSLDHRGKFSRPITAKAPTAEAVFNAILAEDDAWRKSCAEFRTKIETRIQEFLNKDDADLLYDNSPYIDGVPSKSVRTCEHWNDSRVKAKAASAQKLADDHNKRIREAYENRLKLEEQAKLDWIDQCGSTDLKRMVTEQMDYSDMYTSEKHDWDEAVASDRLSAERPGWTVIDQDTAKKIQPAKRPRARAWLVLDTARQVEPTAKLGRLDGKYIAYAEFDGKTIVWPAD